MSLSAVVVLDARGVSVCSYKRSFVRDDDILSPRGSLSHSNIVFCSDNLDYLPAIGDRSATSVANSLEV